MTRLRLAAKQSTIDQATMPRNIEIKAHIPSVEMLIPEVAALASEGPCEIESKTTPSSFGSTSRHRPRQGSQGLAGD
jgi:hypothetical protein